MIRSYRRLWWPAKVLVWLIPGAGLLAIGYAVVVGDGSEPPVHHGSLVGLVEVCPSAPGVHPVEEWAESAIAWTSRGYHLEVVAGLCDGPPAGGEVQIRAWGDRVEGYAPAARHADATLVGLDGWPLSAGVVYVDGLPTSCVRVHELGHVLGWDDAPRMPTSVMGDECGWSFDGLGVPR